MKFNKDKCEVVEMNKDKQIKFKDGTQVKHVNEATYLGSIPTADAISITEIHNIVAAFETIVNNVVKNK